ncbi:MAG: hypothetical protein HY332_18785 [Chloroflexi bacterium]|nr:hypothetical protein [Chloroflexota bacterium]
MVQPIFRQQAGGPRAQRAIQLVPRQLVVGATGCTAGAYGAKGRLHLCPVVGARDG